MFTTALVFFFFVKLFLKTNVYAPKDASFADFRKGRAYAEREIVAYERIFGLF